MGGVVECASQSTNQYTMKTVKMNVEKKGIREGFINRVALVAVAVSFIGATQNSQAATIAWWRFEDTNLGAGTTLTTQVNAPALNATVGASGEGLVAVTPNVAVTTGAGGTMYANSQSFAHAWFGGQSPVNSVGTTQLNNTFVLNQASWTWEAFLNIDSYSYGYGMLFGNGNPTANGIQMDLGADDLSFRFLSGGAAPINTGPLFNFDTWYHVALVAVADAGTWDLTFYVNYSPVANANNVVLDTRSDDFSIFGSLNPAGAFLDEVRISDTALGTSEMLYAVPEPSTTAILGVGIVCLVALRRMRRKVSAEV